MHCIHNFIAVWILFNILSGCTLFFFYLHYFIYVSTNQLWMWSFSLIHTFAQLDMGSCGKLH